MCLISLLRCLLFITFVRIKCNEEQHVIICWLCSLADSRIKFSTEIYIFIKHSKNWNFFTFFDRYSCSMLPWESEFDAQFLLIGFKINIIWEVHPVCAPESNLSVKTPILIWLITKWWIKCVTVKKRLAVEC